jgi:methionine biosynthesis protein MetW
MEDNYMSDTKNVKEDFYESEYAGARHAFVESSTKYLKISGFFKHCKSVLDIGCADGGFLQLLKSSFSISELCGVDFSTESVSLTASKGFRAVRLDIDKEDLPFESGYFDGVFCGEIIEHLFDPDHLLDEIYRVMKKGGVAIVTTPNLASWFNRGFLLLGYQPLFTEVSLRYGVGYPFPFWLKSGHIRVFTLRALKELVRLHEFKVTHTAGFGINTQLGYGRRWRILAEIANKLFSTPSLASDLVLIMTK